MSTLLVPVVAVQNLRVHPNASMLALCDCLGWQMVVPLKASPNGQFAREFVKDFEGKEVPYDSEKHVGLEKFIKNFDFAYANGDKVVYFPIDTLIPAEWADKWNIRNYLQGADKNRVGRIKLRGEPSFGVAVPLPEGQNWEIGTNVAEYFGAQKYEPPIRASCGDADVAHSLLEKYTEIENMRNYPDIFKDGEEVIATEKIHGCFTHDSKVMLVNGEERPISEIVAGDIVVTFNEKTKTFEGKKVKQVIVRQIEKGDKPVKWLKLGLSNGRIVRCTENHLFLTNNRGWVEVKDLNGVDDIVEPV